MSEWIGRVALVLGGDSGIGLAIGEALARAGCDVTLAGVLEGQGVAAQARLLTDGITVDYRCVDVRESAPVDALIEQTVQHRRRLDIMVYSVGVFDGMARCAETDDALWNTILNINLRGCFFASRAALKHMRPAGYGRIVNLSSISALRPTAAGVAYATAKAGIVGMTRQIACDVAADGITVNAICPGVIDTEMRANSQAILGAAVEMQRGVGASPDRYKKSVPAERRGTTAEVASLALYLASDAAAYVTGQAWSIDGGWSAT